MSTFRWSRSQGTITSSCTTCPWTNQDRHEPTLLRSQRAHTADDCRERRENVYVPCSEGSCRNGHDWTLENTGHDTSGRVCLTCAEARKARRTAAGKHETPTNPTENLT